MKKADGYSREDTSLAQGGGHDEDDDKVQNGLGKQDRMVGIDAVLDRSDDGHGADAYSQ